MQDIKKLSECYVRTKTSCNGLSFVAPLWELADEASALEDGEQKHRLLSQIYADLCLWRRAAEHFAKIAPKNKKDIKHLAMLQDAARKNGDKYGFER
ncbi:hypothetical protein [Campylobacter showae]|uniref:hypothetical protein n=1 Tax=Campylobacter showae TaxID=204 RepID=UPI000F0966C3|nr:hypothetical protein [Campylobacter showae]